MAAPLQFALSWLLVIASASPGVRARCVALGSRGVHGSNGTPHRRLSARPFADASVSFEPWIRSERGRDQRGVTANLVVFGRSWHFHLAPQNGAPGWDQVPRNTPELSDCTFYRGKVVSRPLIRDSFDGNATGDTDDPAESTADAAATWCVRRPGLIASASVGGRSFMVMPHPTHPTGRDMAFPPHLGDVAHRGEVLHRVYDEGGPFDEDAQQGENRNGEGSLPGDGSQRRATSSVGGKRSRMRQNISQDHLSVDRIIPDHGAHQGCASHQLPPPPRPPQSMHQPYRYGKHWNHYTDDYGPHMPHSTRALGEDSRRRTAEANAEEVEDPPHGYELVELTVVIDRKLCANMNGGGLVASCLGGMAWAANIVQIMDMCVRLEEETP